MCEETYLRHEYILIKEIILEHNRGHAVLHARINSTVLYISFSKGMANDQAGSRAQCWTKQQLFGPLDSMYSLSEKATSDF